MPDLPDKNTQEPGLLISTGMKKAYTSIESALEQLEQEGYTHHFIKKDNYFHCPEKDLNFYTHELNITEAYRHENKTDPEKNAVLYAIEASNYGLKGTLLN